MVGKTKLMMMVKVPGVKNGFIESEKPNNEDDYRLQANLTCESHTV